MNVLVINWQDIRNPMSGGAEVHLFEIFSRIASWGHQVHLMCSGFDGAEPEEILQGIQVFRIGARNTFNFCVPSAYRYLEEAHNFDLVVEDLNKIPFYGPFYVKKPILAITHHLFGTAIFRETWLPMACYVFLAERAMPLVYRDIRFCAVSESTKRELDRLKVTAHRVEVIHNCVDHELYRTEDVARFPEPTIAFLGRVRKYKRVDLLIRAMPEVVERLPKTRLLIIGEGEDRPRLQALTRRLGLDSIVTFTGYVSDTRKAEYLQRVHAVVNPSVKEGWGLTNIEANACGTPAVASDVPGLRDSVVPGETGLLFPYGDLPALVDSIVKLLTDQALHARLSEGAVAWASRFHWDAAAQSMLNLMERVASQGH